MLIFFSFFIDETHKMNIFPTLEGNCDVGKKRKENHPRNERWGEYNEIESNCVSKKLISSLLGS